MYFNIISTILVGLVYARPNIPTTSIIATTAGDTGTPIHCSNDVCYRGLPRVLHDVVRLLSIGHALHSPWFVVCERLKSNPSFQPECLKCPANLVFNEVCQQCVTRQHDLVNDCSSVVTTLVPTTTGTPLPKCSLADYVTICGKTPFLSLRGRPDDKTQFLTCGSPYQACLRCPSNLVFDDATQCCNYP